MTDPGRVRRRDSVLAALEEARKLHPRVNLTTLIVFLYVAENPGINMIELAQVTQQSLPTTSRAARSLWAKDADGALPPYLGLLQQMTDAPDLRTRNQVLTDRGQQLQRRIDEIISRAITIEENTHKQTC